MGSRCAAGGVTRGAVEVPLKLVAMVSGRAVLSTDGIDHPVELGPGDVALVNNRSWLELEGAAGDGPPRVILPEENEPSVRRDRADRGVGDVVIGGRVDLNPVGQALLSQALPPVGHVRASAATATNLHGTLDRLFDEVSSNRPGSTFAIRQYGQLLILDVVRAYVDQTELPPGWLRALTDDRLRPALALMHGEPGKQWGLEELARAVAMSRTSFAERFRKVAGVPPLGECLQQRVQARDRRGSAESSRGGWIR